MQPTYHATSFYDHNLVPSEAPADIDLERGGISTPVQIPCSMNEGLSPDIKEPPNGYPDLLDKALVQVLM